MSNTTSSQTTDSLLIATFLIGDTAFGIDARLVLEVVKVGEFTPIRGAPTGVCGARNLRGRIVTVVDMATHLGLGCVNIGLETRLLIMEHRGDSFGFMVDAVTDTIALNAEHMFTPPEGMDPDLRSRLNSVWRENDRLTAILDAGELFKWKDE